MNDLSAIRVATKIMQWALMLFAVLMIFPSAYFEMTRHDPFLLLTARMMNMLGVLALLISSSFTVLLRRIQAIEQKLNSER